MPKVDIINQTGKSVEKIELSDYVFGIEPHQQALYDVVNAQRAAMRQGTHDVKNRSEVSGGGRKPWRQKGTGRARQGSIRSPQWRGGGVVFGPTPRSYAYKIPKKVRRLTLFSALSTKAREENIIVLEGLAFEAPKTKDFIQVLKDLAINKKALIVTADLDETVALSARNIPGIRVV